MQRHYRSVKEKESYCRRLTGPVPFASMLRSYKLYLMLLISSIFFIVCQNQGSITNLVSNGAVASSASVDEMPLGVPDVVAAPLQALGVGNDGIELLYGDTEPGLGAEKIRSRSLNFKDMSSKQNDRSSSTSAATSSSAATTTSTTTTTVRTTPTTTTAKVTKSAKGKPISSATGTDGRVADVPYRFPVDTKLLPPLYIITPTYRRPEQIPELTRLGYTLKHVQNVLWIVVEDSENRTATVARLLEEIGVPFVQLAAPMPAQYRKHKVKPRGVSNRNRALQWIRANATEGTLYFADDDNTYNLKLFEQLRHVRKVAMFPVGLISKYQVSSPVVKNGTITGFYDGWLGGRKYPLDMAGFAVSVKFLHTRPKAQMPFKPGYEEDGFLRSLEPLELKEVDLLASNCTEILTWHTQARKNPPAPALDQKKYGGTNLVQLTSWLV
ncbi:galactosylgalactosylxylosylprotein 3-beta-glucuronosyltransferase P [Anopheles funestus]|uniref:galactosylgalactosylxylosylprotein 3-beta-glucuronosyltransferase P n=1 Tax=Anopheles funestus TaxID=62324 RepID=UPI0020C60FAE|nr:galactosylgalactosylxylosylprotein 3-beta-glucuronosyltransferase P [Anopheles funestus]XP_049281846.1 galactosylgalactosylxylosylprotein 3-beta-glucuronosyltransferase P [Anopheles funestus]XP_049281847.1 galactosylgalactosylxylosylprotein 3-beta-glucuronosyltransferase P [Anopheles funestus]XP_049281848.1 galactosylgalactosylxylosylprotein 3-beta-glucuronosyltransferase P [Anopheles funestus]XP_049281849.1 galactosylgalactosylxylosylprotein 3-beta-glucuronosyltransferase P [Anopheles funes